MSTTRMKQNAPTHSSNLEEPVMFSVNEAESHYLVAVDIPTIPSLAVQILSSRDALEIKGIFPEAEEAQTVFLCRPKGKGIQATYQNGVLWLMLPKGNSNSNSRPAQLQLA